MEESKGEAFVCKQSFVLFFVLFSLVSSAQNLEQRFIVFPQQKVIRMEEINIVSNVVLIKNNANTEVRFSLDATMPKGWKLLSAKAVYTINGNDSLFVPVRIIPAGPLKGNTEYIIDLIAYTANKVRLASTSFSILVIKKTNWSLSIEPATKIYFLNNSTKTNFTVRYSNNGDDDEPVLTTFKQTDKKISITDSSGNVIENYKDIFTLRSRQDTQVTFNISLVENTHNIKRVDLDNHLPNSTDEEKKFLLFLQSSEANSNDNNTTFRKSERIEFIKLPNRKKINPYASDALPLVVENNIFNVMGIQPIMYLNLRGNTLLENNANVFYFAQTSYSSYFATPDYARNIAYYTGYFQQRGDIQIGDMSGSGTIGFQSFGRGIKGSYNFTKRHNAGGFLLKSPRLSDPNGSVSYGANYRFSFHRSDYASVQVSRSENLLYQTSTNFVTATTRVNLFKNHGITLGGGISTRGRAKGNLKKNGTYLNLNYSGLFLQNRLSSVFRLSNLSKSFGASGSGRFYIYHQTGFTVSRKLVLMMQNNYTAMHTSDNSGYNYFNNQLFFNIRQQQGVVVPSVLFNTQNTFGLRRHLKGVGFDYNYYHILSNIKVSASLRMGFNKLIDYRNVPSFFSANANLLTQFRTLSFTMRYFYGPTVVRNADDIRNIRRYPQTFFTSLQHQIIFRKEYFVWQNSLNYAYYNQFYSHSLGYFPEVYLFAQNGWRFRMGIGVSMNISNPKKALEMQNPGQLQGSDEINTNIVTTNLNVQLGVRKQFGIPVPRKFTHTRSVTITYLCFMDLNGNRVKDKTEPELENIVIRTGDEEIMTDLNGQAELTNLEAGRYKIGIINLSDSKTWFPVVADSILMDRSKIILIPFVKGAKITGQIYMQRERHAVDEETSLDLSRIIVSALDSMGNIYRTLTRMDGTFELYVPNARYTLNLDAGVWGDQFTVVNNNLIIELNLKTDNTFVSFQVVERQRKLQIKKF
jgi:hypothetical protein